LVQSHPDVGKLLNLFPRNSRFPEQAAKSEPLIRDFQIGSLWQQLHKSYQKAQSEKNRSKVRTWLLYPGVKSGSDEKKAADSKDYQLAA